ncbi:MAG: alpha-glucosidase [Clostridia bacterium]|jgi:alpha-glucosidase|nr:alpha-glucosidase [Clostridia bacterium]
MNWQKEAVVYQIYPRSFKDSDGDGIGDLRGIIEKLDYLKDLGVDVIWICPIYESPNDDNGYDISHYECIMTEFGTMQDFDELLQKVHKKGMKLLMDLVINHTSDQHPWFIESKSSQNSAKRDWYIWHEGKEGREPNNWASIFGGSAWEYDDETKAYYLHLFSKKMPDLNWENQEVREALYAMINRWLGKGIDGFRIDAISHIKKEDFEDISNPKGLKYVPSFTKHMNKEGILTFLQELKENTFDKYDILTVGEANGVKAEEGIRWVGETEGKFTMIFQFEHLHLWSEDDDKQSKIYILKQAMSKWQTALDQKGWNALYIENHDLTRAVSSLGSDSLYLVQSAKALGLMYFMQQGTPFIYQGQELGMTNSSFKTIQDHRDIATINRYYEDMNKGIDTKEALMKVSSVSRDHSRTPMQWSPDKHAGFTNGTPWIKVNENYKFLNASTEAKDEDSVLNFYKKMIWLRKKHKTLIYGAFTLLLEEDKQIYAYTRKDPEGEYLIICNLSDKEAAFSADFFLREKQLLLNSYPKEDIKHVSDSKLRPYEARLYKIL